MTTSLLEAPQLKVAAPVEDTFLFRSGNTQYWLTPEGFRKMVDGKSYTGWDRYDTLEDADWQYVAFTLFKAYTSVEADLARANTSLAQVQESLDFLKTFANQLHPKEL